MEPSFFNRGREVRKRTRKSPDRLIKTHMLPASAKRGKPSFRRPRRGKRGGGASKKTEKTEQ